MKTRPWPLIVLALFQLLSPVATVFFNAWILGVRPIFVWGWILEKPWLKVFESLALMPIAGLALLGMRPWSYAIFFGAMAWSFGSNLLNWNTAAQTQSLGFLIVIYVMQIALALYFLIPAVRRTYFDASVRWWEAKRRYLLQLPAEIELADSAQSLPATLLNISEGGAFLRTTAPLKKGSVFRVKFSVLSVPFATQAEAVHVAAKSGTQSIGENDFGARFILADAAQSARFANLIRGLDLIGLVDRDGIGRKPWIIGAWDWFVGLMKTGKGILPELKGNRRG